MPAKMARSARRSPFGLPEATAVVRAASLSCQNEGKAPKFSRNRESSGESRLRASTPDRSVQVGVVLAPAGARQGGMGNYDFTNRLIHAMSVQRAGRSRHASAIAFGGRG
jgi:hypothetical protein